MKTNQQIDNHFYLQKEKFDGLIHIEIKGQTNEELEKVMNSIIFILEDYELHGFPILKNNLEISRKIYFRKK